MFFIVTYLIFTMLFMMFAVFVAGYSKDMSAYDREEFITCSIFLAAVCPLALVAVILIAPFCGIFYLGRLIRERK
jgi:hypothetical protein